MARLLGVEIPNEKKIEYSLPYVYGIGLSISRKILAATNIDPAIRQIFRPAAQLQLLGHTGGAGAEEHALHLAGNHEATTDRLHHARKIPARRDSL